MHVSPPFIAALISMVGALDCTQPGLGAGAGSFDICTEWQVCWTYESYDPTNVCIYLHNNIVSTAPHMIRVGGPVSRDARCTLIRGACWREVGEGLHFPRVGRCDDPRDIPLSDCRPVTISQPCCTRSRVNRREYEDIGAVRV
ncbi:hypothetical protein BJX66DRAFT_303478 [Aspergillus keveii]|uniref:Uncharacterized protein n=1 Tax=Aspergillus keveii TaxID=714993 RepID=A0ABR4G6H4_9EURO